MFEVTAIAHRDNPIFQTIVPGWNEHIYIGNVLPREPLLMRFAIHASKNVQAVHIPPYTNGFLVVVQLGKKTNMGEPRNVALGAFAAHPNFRVCVVVESDVNIYDPSDLMWALTTRVDWGTGHVYRAVRRRAMRWTRPTTAKASAPRSGLTRRLTRAAARMARG